MTDHDWAAERIAAHATGGLPADEAVRLESHIAECADCAAALNAARALDQRLDALFAPTRPGAAVDVRVVRKLRQEWTRRTVLAGWHRKLAAGVAASVGLGLTGAGASLLAGSDGLPLPGGGRLLASANGREPMPVALLGGEDGVQAYHARRGEPKSVLSEIRDSVNLSVTLGDKLASSVEETKARTAATDSSLAYGFRAKEFAPPVNQPAPAVEFAIPALETSGVEAKAAGAASSFKLRTEAVNDGYFKPDAYFLKAPASTTELSVSPAVELGAVATNGATADARKVLEARLGNDKAQQANQHLFGMRAFTPVVPANPAPAPVVGQPPKAPDPAPVIARKVIRSGDIEFEVESFDSSVATITKLVAAINGGYIATVNSEKLPNGKVKGSVVVRVPPESLDGFVLDLRRDLGKTGELKGQKIGSQDITKQYFDLESRLKAARAMETRLLEMIKTGKGEIKQLLDAEKELGIWRTKIEEYEGELRFYANQVSLSTLTITLAEKEIRAAAGLTESERVQAGVEVEEVEPAFRQIQTAIAEAKGRITKSELKQLAAGQFNATLNFEVAPDAAGPLRDRLKQLGRVARLEIDRVQTADGPVTKDSKVKKGDTLFLVQLYNLANIAPRESAVLTVAVTDVPSAYQALRDAVSKASGRVLVAQLNEQDRQNVSAQLDFEVKRTEEGAIRAALDAAGDVIARQVNRAPESDNVTDTKVRFQATLLSATRLRPRETTVLSVEVVNVEAAVAVLTAQANEAKGRQVDIRTDRDARGKVTARLTYDVPLAAVGGVIEQVKHAGKVRISQSTRDLQAPEGKFAVARLDVTLTNAEEIVAPDDGIWPQVRKGLTYSASVLLMSVSWLVVGLCVFVPWVLVGYGGYRLVRRVFRRPEAPTA